MTALVFCTLHERRLGAEDAESRLSWTRGGVIIGRWIRLSPAYFVDLLQRARLESRGGRCKGISLFDKEGRSADCIIDTTQAEFPYMAVWSQFKFIPC